MEVKEVLTYIKLRKFMSFDDITFDFRDGSKGFKKFIAIYGENGSGKSNFVNSIDFLCSSINSFEKTVDDELFEEIKQNKELPQQIIELLYDKISILNYAQKCRMIESDEDTSIEYGFEVNGHEGYYSLKFNERFSYEKLYYFTGKQRGTLFEIAHEKDQINIKFSGKLFLDKKIENEIKELIYKYWGKHTFLSILQNEAKEKNELYLEERIMSYVFDILMMFENISFHCKKSSRYGAGLCASKPINVMRDLEEGKIKSVDKKQLDCSEKIINNFLTQAYADIKEVFYKTNIDNDMIQYKLFVKKMIGGKVRTVSFDKESAGTQRVLEIIRSLLGAFCGVTVVYDEIDDGIHDLLLKNILMSMVDDITGQLIITTHNTLILEKIDIKSAYIINADYKGNKEVKCLDRYPRIQDTNNPRIMYLKGMFGGVPIVDDIDYDEIICELKEQNKKH